MPQIQHPRFRRNLERLGTEKRAAGALILLPSSTLRLDKEWNQCVSKVSVQKLTVHEKVADRQNPYLTVALQCIVSKVTISASVHCKYSN